MEFSELESDDSGALTAMTPFGPHDACRPFGGLGYFSGVVGLFFLVSGLRHLAGWSGLFPLLATCAVVAALSFVLVSPDFLWHGAA